jgi:hypothetical protein
MIMKNFLLTILIACTFAPLCFPQGMTDKGSMSLSGAAFFSYTKYSDDAIDRKISLQPGISYFIWDKFEVGINAQVSYSHYTGTFEYIRDYFDWDNFGARTSYIDTRIYGIGIFAAKYFGMDEAKPFITSSIGYSYVSYSPSDIYYYENPIAALTISFGFGYLIPLNENIALTPLLQYEILNYQQGVEKRYPFEKIQESRSFSLGAQLKVFFNKQQQ